MRKQMMVRYRVAASRAEENERLIAAVFEQLHDTRPAGLRYASLKLGDGLGFVHLVSVDTVGDENPLTALPAFQSFLAGLRDRCDEPPVSTAWEPVGAYGFFEVEQAA